MAETKIDKIDFKKLSEKWTKYWQDQRIYQPDLTSAKNRFYNLMMFPYPSAEGLHVGNMYAFTGADVYGRFKRMQGNSVFEPIGLDGFGIHSENYALKIGSHPMTQSKISEKRFYEQLHMIGNGYDWEHTVETYKPNYYKWTQWIFTTFFKAGLVVKKKSPVNWCPKDKTVLADEQVINGCCERCGSVVETRELDQWFFRITEYAQRLLDSLDRIDWTEKVKLAQRNWIGKSEGLLFEAPVKDTDLKIQTFSAHFEAFYADTFVVIAPDHPFLPKLIEGVSNRAEIEKFAKKLVLKRKDEKPGQEKEPEGIFTGRYVVDPVGNGDLPIWVANYALKDYGTGIVKCSAHDVRDFAFAKKYGLRLKPVLFPADPELRKQVENQEICFTDMKNGILSEPKEFDGRVAGEVRSEIIEYAKAKGFAKTITNYHLRDWLISRQRYWGAPIPMIFCQTCHDKDLSYFTTEGFEKSKIRNSKFEIRNSAHEWAAGWFPVEDSDLPVELPYVKEFKPLGTGEAPLAQDSKFVNVKCPNCGSDAKRETDVCDTFLDSSWYFLRYPATDFEYLPFPSKEWNKSEARNPKSETEIGNWKLEIGNSARRAAWLPVSIYIGGAEHSVLHLLYSRFVGHVLHDLGFTSFEEPFPKFRAHGLIVKEGAKMSKSKGNVVNPDVYVEKFGADAIRLYLMFLGPFSEGGDFRDSGMEGMGRFVKRIWKFANYQLEGSSDTFSAQDLDILMNKTIKSVSADIESLSYNTAIARIMEYVNELTKKGTTAKLDSKYIRTLILLLAPFAPFITDELFHKLDPKNKSVHIEAWPKFDEKLTKDQFVTIAIQVNGKLRDTLSMGLDQSANQKEVEKLAFDSPKIKTYTQGKEVKKTIYVVGKVLNIVI